MSDRVLTIDANDLAHFSLRVEGGTIIVGRDPGSGDGTLKNLHIKGIHCEFLVSDDFVAVSGPDASGQSSAQEMVVNQELTLTSARFCVMLPPSESSVGDKGELDYRLVALNGVEFGRVFHLKEAGSTRIGTDPRAANIVLRDNFAAKVQCRVDVADGHAFVTHLDGTGGTFVNKQATIGRTEIRTGDVLRVGNTQLRFELGKASGSVPSRSDVSPPKVNLAAPALTPPQQLPQQQQPPAPRPIAQAPSPRVLSPLDQLLQLENQTFGRFQIENILGRGHVGVMFRALDLKTNQAVALKVLSPEFPRTDAELEHFSRVFKPAAALKDSHLVSLKCLGRTDNYTWIAREFVGGECLWKRIERLPVDKKANWKRACRIGAQIGAALDYLHQHNIAHINLTPRNVLIRKEDRVVKLADVLLAQALHGSHVHQETRAKKRLAEAAFLAPEQLAGTSEPDSRCDLYALGVMCYFLATGRPPYSGHSIDELQSQINWGAVATPSKYFPDIPPPFEAAILKLLSRKPESRFANVAEFLDIVEPIIMMHDIR